jgi:hypothetical protein
VAGSNTGDQDLSGKADAASFIAGAGALTGPAAPLTIGTAAGAAAEDFALLAGRAGGQTLIGGTAVGDALSLQGTAGNGTASGAAINLNVGNNGALTALSVANNGAVTIATGALDLQQDGASKLKFNPTDNQLTFARLDGKEPGINFGNENGGHRIYTTTNSLDFIINTVPVMRMWAYLSNANVTFSLETSFGWGLNGNDTAFERDAAGIVAFRSSATLTSPKSVRLYNTTDSGNNNYERFAIDWHSTANRCLLRTEAGGSGTLRGMSIQQATGALSFFDATPVVQPAGAGQAVVTLGNTDAEIGGLTISAAYDQTEVTALRDKCEELADDVRALSTLIHSLRTALVNLGAIKGAA